MNNDKNIPDPVGSIVGVIILVCIGAIFLCATIAACRWMLG